MSARPANQGANADDIYACKYAFCATIDEAILMSQFKAKEAWQRITLQVQYFGEQLAGEQFFTKLEELRRHGSAQIQVLEGLPTCACCWVSKASTCSKARKAELPDCSRAMKLRT